MDVSVTAASSPQQDLSTLSQATFPAATTRCRLPFLWLFPPPTPKDPATAECSCSCFLRPSREPRHQRQIQSRGSDLAHAVGDISYKSTQPVHNPNTQEHRASTGERLQLAEYTLPRQICFLRVTEYLPCYRRQIFWRANDLHSISGKLRSVLAAGSSI